MDSKTWERLQRVRAALIEDRAGATDAMILIRSIVPQGSAAESLWRATDKMLEGRVVHMLDAMLKLRSPNS